jgi:hypothetical protein
MVGVTFMPILGYSSGNTGAAVALTATGSDTTNLTTYTFSGLALGAADATRFIVVGISANATNGRTISSASIGGVAATVDLLYQNSGNSRNGHAGFISAAVPTGVTGDVVVTWSAGMTECFVTVYRAINLTTGAIHDFDPATDVNPISGGAVSLSVDVPTGGGFVVGSACLVSGTTFSWTAGVTKDLDFNDVAGESDPFSLGSSGFLPAQTGYSVTASTNGSTPSRVAIASYG